ncbi:site-specific integrase [Vibrio fluvialis]
MKYLTQKKTGTWYFRYQVPFLYRRFFGNRTEIKKSLQTSDKIAAHIKALKLEATIKERIMTIKQYLSLEAANELIATHTGATLMKIECAMDPMGELSQAYMASMLSQVAEFDNLSAEDINALMSPVEYLYKSDSSPIELANKALTDFQLSPIDPLAWQTRQALAQVFQYAKDAQAALKSSDKQSCESIVKQLEDTMLKIDPDPELAASITSEPLPEAQVIQLHEKSTGEPKDKRSLFELFEEYEKEQKGSVADRTLKAMKAKCIVVSELLEEIPASQVTRKDVISTRDLLARLPKNKNKYPVFNSLTSLEAINKNESLEEPYDCISPTTVSEYLEKISSIFIWAMRYNYLTYNPFDSIKVAKSKSKEVDERDPYSKEQLITLFSTPIFTENKMLHSYQYWSLLIALYSGARQNEIAQLFVDNILEIDGVWCFFFKEVNDTQNFKNEASVRITPIHKRLIELGFLEFVSTCKDRLFETGLPNYGERGYGKELSRWFNESYKIKLGFKAGEKTDFHSYRHTVIDFYKQHTNLEERFVQAIVGHKNGAITFDRYGSEFSPSVLKPFVDMIDFDFLDIQAFSLTEHGKRTQKELTKAARRLALKERKAQQV